MARAGCPPRPTRLAKATTFRRGVEALERRVVRLAGGDNVELLNQVRRLRDQSETLENRAKLAGEAYRAVRAAELRSVRLR